MTTVARSILCVRCYQRFGYEDIEPHLAKCPKKTYACVLCGHTGSDHYLRFEREGYIGGRFIDAELGSIALCHGVVTDEEKGGRGHSCLDRWKEGARPDYIDPDDGTVWKWYPQWRTYGHDPLPTDAPERSDLS